MGNLNFNTSQFYIHNTKLRLSLYHITNNIKKINYIRNSTRGIEINEIENKYFLNLISLKSKIF